MTSIPTKQLEDKVHVNINERRQCGYCGLRSGHRYDGDCKIMSETGYLLKKDEIDNFKINLTHCEHDSKLQSFTLPSDTTKITQIPPKTSFVCVHGYGQIEQDSILSQSLENESNFLCVSFMFSNSMIKAEYDKCFVQALAVSDWMSIKKNNDCS